MKVRDIINDLLRGHDPSLSVKVHIEFEGAQDKEIVKVLEVKRVTGVDPHIAIVVFSQSESTKEKVENVVNKVNKKGAKSPDEFAGN